MLPTMSLMMCVCCAGSNPLLLRFSRVVISASAKHVKTAVLQLKAAAAELAATMRREWKSALCVAARSAVLCESSAAEEGGGEGREKGEKERGGSNVMAMEDAHRCFAAYFGGGQGI